MAPDRKVVAFRGFINKVLLALCRETALTMNAFWHSSPFVRLLIPFGLGIVFGLRSPDVGWDTVVFCAATCLLALVFIVVAKIFFKGRMSLRQYFGVGITAFLLMFGFVYVQLKHASPRWEAPPSQEYAATVHSYPDPKTKTYAVLLKIGHWRDSLGAVHPVRMKVHAYIRKDSISAALEPGDELVIYGYVSTDGMKVNPGQFDYSKYLVRQGISGTVFLDSDNYRLTGRRSGSAILAIKRLRGELIRNWYLNAYDDRENGVIAALILGDRSYLEEDLREDFVGAGAVHILAVSGLHVGIVYLFVLSILGFLLRGPRWRVFNAMVVLLILWFYAAITGFSPSVLRAATMFSFIAIGKLGGHRSNTYNMISASAFFLLAIDPFLLGQVGFQLSYLAVIGIVFLNPKIHGLFTFKSRLAKSTWSLLVVSVSAQLATFPLSVHYFGQFPVYFFLTNLMVIPLAWVILHTGVLWLLTFSIPYVGEFFAYITNLAAYLLNESVVLVNSIPGAVMKGTYFSGFTGILVYIFILALVGFLARPGRARMRFAYAVGMALLLIYSTKSVERARQSILFFPVGAHVPTAVEIQGDQATVYVAQDLAGVRSNVGYLIDGFLGSHGVRRVQWQEMPRCSHPDGCGFHVVHALPADAFAAMEAQTVENSIVYVSEEASESVDWPSADIVIAQVGEVLPSVVEIQASPAVHPLDEKGAIAMNY